MRTRPTVAAGTQTMTWDAEGKLATSQDATGTTSYLYDADGNRLLRNDPLGKTLYLPGQELRYTTADGAKKGTRYYTHAGETIATRTAAGGVVWLSGDHHGTARISVTAIGQAVSIRRETPFGELRATTGSWPAAMDKGFVGGTVDNTGLTHLGAREYDPVIGRFISVDPVIDADDPQQLHGYAYANNAPITASDANGLWPNWNKIVHSVVNTVVQAAVAPAKFVYDHAGVISTVTGVAALACTFIPPLQAIAPVLGAVSAVTGAIDTAKSCAHGQALDCAIGVAGMIPGGRLLSAGKGVYQASKAVKGAEELADAARATRSAAKEAAEEGHEVFYRTMSPEHAAELRATGRLPPTRETFVSPTRSFSENYQGTLVQFITKPGTTRRLAEVGVRDTSRLVRSLYPDMPRVARGWTALSAFFKAERGQINIGLGRGPALDIFNNHIVRFKIFD